MVKDSQALQLKFLGYRICGALTIDPSLNNKVFECYS